jgi:hypothetical protein
MQSPKFAFDLIDQFAKRIGTTHGKTILELGPGDSVNTAIIARALGFEKSVLIDDSFFASENLEDYQKTIKFLSTMSLTKGISGNFTSISSLLIAHNGHYLTNGIDSFNEVNDSSIDLVFSNAVLEHIEKQEINRLMIQTYRVLKKQGMAIHRIDFRDHIQGDFNHLRYGESFWNSNLIRRAGCYVNRLHPDEFVEAAKTAGFAVEVSRKSSTREASKVKINACLPRYKKQSNLLEGFDIVLTKTG